MPKRAPDPELIVAITAEARIAGVRATAKKWHVSPATVLNYSRRVEESPELKKRVREKILTDFSDVAAATSEALCTAIVAARIRITTMEGPDDAACLMALAKLLKNLVELDIFFKTLEHEKAKEAAA